MTLILSGTNGLSDVDGSAATPAIRGTDANTGIFFPAADTIAFSEGGTESMRLDSSGNVGLGTSSPSQKLHVVGKVLATDNLEFSTSDTAVVFQSGAGRFFTGGSERARIDSSGNLLIGTTNTSATAGTGFKFIAGDRLAIVSAGSTAGTTSLSLYSTGASALRFYVQDSGQINATSTSISGISDATLKTNIRDLETGLAEVMALQPRRFDWLNGDGQNVAGFVSQEVENILPDLVTESVYAYDENNNDIRKKFLKMGDMLPTLVKAIQEQQQMIETLQAEVTALKGVQA